MRVTPKTDKQIAEENLWPIDTEYSFEVAEAFDKISKSGNEMIELKVKVFNDDGGFRIFNDYLLDSLAFKIKHFSEATGNFDKYQSGTIAAADCIGKSGRLKLKIQKDKNGVYADKNVIGDYVVEKDDASGEVNVAHVAQQSNPIKDDTIPF